MSDEDLKAESPFTKPLSASMVLRKEEQTKAKAHPPGPSKILSKARKKAADNKKVPSLACVTVCQVYCNGCCWFGVVCYRKDE